MFSPGEIAELEKKYSKYIFKKIFKNILFLLSIIFVLAGFYYFFVYSSADVRIHKKIIKNVLKAKIKKINTKTNKTIKKVIKSIDSNMSVKNSEKNISHSSSAVVQEAKIVKHIVLDDDMKEKNNKLSKNLDNRHKITNQLVFHLELPDNKFFDKMPSKSLNLNILSIDKKEIIKKYKKKVYKNDTIKKKKILKPKIKIEMRDIDSTKYLKSKFEKTHDIIFALMLCEEFYSQKDYISSLKWSIIANDIDNQSERSWIWFAKSKFRLGKKDDAIKALKAFLRTNESSTIKLLLKNIQNGSLDD